MQRTSLPCEKGKKRDIPFLLLPPPGFNSCSFFSATQPTEEQRATAKKNRVEGDLRRWAHLCCPIPSGSTRGFRTEFGLLLRSPAAERPHSHLTLGHFMRGQGVGAACTGGKQPQYRHKPHLLVLQRPFSAREDSLCHAQVCFHRWRISTTSHPPHLRAHRKQQLPSSASHVQPPPKAALNCTVPQNTNAPNKHMLRNLNSTSAKPNDCTVTQSRALPL